MKRVMIIAIAAVFAACDGGSDKPDVKPDIGTLDIDEARRALPDISQLDIDVPTEEERAAKKAEIEAKKAEIEAKIAEMKEEAKAAAEAKKEEIDAKRAEAKAAAEAKMAELEAKLIAAIKEAEYIPAVLPAETAAVAKSVNGKVIASLAKVQLMANLEKANCTDNVCTFGPAPCSLGAHVYRMTITKTGADAFTWALQGAKLAAATIKEQCMANIKAKAPVTVDAAAWVNLIYGESTVVPAAEPVDGGRKAPPKAKGSITHDFDAAATLMTLSADSEIEPPTGKIVASFDNTGDTATVNVTATGLPKNTAGTYAFAANAQGGTLEANVTSDVASKKISSKWNATGAGKASVEGSIVMDGATKQGSIAECWDGNGEETYLFNAVYRKTTPVPENAVEAALANLGDAAKCIQ